jgi:mRNA interferase HigB
LQVISRKALVEACLENKYRAAASEVDAWERVASKTEWGSLDDIRKTYPDADGITIGNRIYTVFNICGNQFRLIVQINHQHKMIFFKRLMSHAEYDRDEWKKSLKREQERQGIL